MGKLTFDIVEGFSAEIGTRGKRIARGFILEKIDTSIPPIEIAGFVQNYTAAMDENGVGMTAMASAFPDSRYEDALQTSIVIQGLLHDAVRGQVIYSQDPGGFTPTTYVVTRTRQMVQHQETILPDVGDEPGGVIRAELMGPEGPIVPHDFVPMTFRRSSPVVIFEGLKVGEPDDDGADYIGFVNRNPFRGKAKGHWYLDDYTTSFSRYSGYSQFRIVIAANILGRDWSSWGTLFNAAVGKYVKVEQNDVDDVAEEPYKYGQIGFNSFGFVRTGGYPTVDFASIGVPTV